MLGAGLPQVSAGWVLMSWGDAVPAPGSPGGEQALPRARAESCVCPGSLLLLPASLPNKPAFSGKERNPETVQGEKPHQPNRTDRYRTQMPFMRCDAIQL